jgi:hypothetical protein
VQITVSCSDIKTCLISSLHILIGRDVAKGMRTVLLRHLGRATTHIECPHSIG